MLQRLSESLRHHGLLGTVGLAASLPVRVLVRSTRLRRRFIQYQDRRFDRKYGVETAGSIQLSSLDIESENRRFGVRYEGTEVHTFAHMMGSVDIDHNQYTFLDLGSGKGRTLLLASTFRFKQIIGVEFSPELAAIAERNIRTFRNPAQVCKNLLSVCADATTYVLPDGPLLIYLANPFQEPVMARVLDNLRVSLDAHPRTVYIVYFNPKCKALLDAAPFLQGIAHRGWFSIHRSSASAPRDPR